MAKENSEIKGTRRMVLLALLLAVGVGLHALEAAIPVPIALPGAKLGLANVVTLISLYALGPYDSVLLAVARVLLGGLVTGTFGSTSFMMALAGASGSGLVMAAFRWATLSKGRFAAACSMAGAVGHNMSQLLAFTAISGTSKVFVMLPYLLAVALPAGYFTGLGGVYALMAVKKAPGFKQRLEEVSTAAGRRSVLVTSLVMALLVGTAFGAVKLSEKLAAARVEGAAGWSIRIESFIMAGSQKGQLVRSFPWPSDGSSPEGRFLARGRLGDSVLEYDDELGVRFISSPCPDKLCVRHGWVNDEMDLAACLPNGLVVTVEENGKP